MRILFIAEKARHISNKVCGVGRGRGPIDNPRAPLYTESQTSRPLDEPLPRYLHADPLELIIF